MAQLFHRCTSGRQSFVALGTMLAQTSNESGSRPHGLLAALHCLLATRADDLIRALSKVEERWHVRSCMIIIISRNKFRSRRRTTYAMCRSSKRTTSRLRISNRKHLKRSSKVKASKVESNTITHTHTHTSHLSDRSEGGWRMDDEGKTKGACTCDDSGRLTKLPTPQVETALLSTRLGVRQRLAPKVPRTTFTMPTI